LIDVSDLIGIPYVDNGRTLEGLDCYGLAIIVEKRLGKTLIDVVYENHDVELSAKYVPLLNIKKSDIIKEGSLLEIHVGNTLHVAVALDSYTMIHATTNQGVRISKIAAYKINAIYEVT
jgi:cell wall-associated NlpC family hydrolase